MKCESAHLGQHAWIDLLTIERDNFSRRRRPVSPEGAFCDLPDVWVSDLDEAVRRAESAV
jgi:hypothetical protein